VGTRKEDRGSKSRSLDNQPACRGKGISRRFLRQIAKKCSDGVKVKVQVKDWVSTRAAQKAQDKDAEDNKVTCLDFGADRHREWNDHGADLCDQCDKYDNLVPEKKNRKRRIQKQYWCTVTGHMKGCPTTSAGNWLASHHERQASVPPEVPPPLPHNNPLVNESSFGNNRGVFRIVSS
jgi:hypothetical protein